MFSTTAAVSRLRDRLTCSTNSAWPRKKDAGYYVRKVLHTSGASRCFGQVEVQVWLDGKKQITRHEVQGGRWLTAEEYAAEMGRRAAGAEAAASEAGRRYSG
jgi:hypothetical protein